jgi:hypothetical protein
MRRETLCYIGLGTFLGCWILQFALPCVFQNCPMQGLLQLTGGTASNFILLNLIFALLAFFIVSLSDSLQSYIRSLRFFRPRIGDILISRGHITEQQLNWALSLQKMRIGELLVHLGCITETELNDALERQKSMRKRIGEILVELGHCSAYDVEWAAERVHQKLGKILLDWGLIHRDELHAALGKQWYGRNFSTY